MGYMTTAYIQYIFLARSPWRTRTFVHGERAVCTDVLKISWLDVRNPLKSHENMRTGFNRDSSYRTTS